MATLTATPEPDFTPPRVRLDLNADDPTQTFTSIRVRRDGVLLREQPYTGGETATVYDYETPRSEPVTYTAEVSTSGWSTLLDVTWADLTGWTTFSGSPSVGGGRLQTGAVYRLLTQNQPTRVVIPDLTTWPSGTVQWGPFIVSTKTSGQVRLEPRDGSSSGVGIAATSGQATVTYDNNLATLAANGQTKSLSMTPAGNTLAASSVTGPFRIETPTTTTPSTVEATTQLDVRAVWLVNPVAPSVSAPIDSGDCADGGGMAEIIWPSGSDRVSEDRRNVHLPVGRSRAVVITTGPRMDHEWELSINAPTVGVQQQLNELLYNQSPLLLLVPPTYDHDIQGGWYSVGRVTIRRDEPKVSYEPVTFTLPLTPIDPPAVSQGAVRTWGDVLSEAATWADLVDKYPTWADVLVGS